MASRYVLVPQRQWEDLCKKHTKNNEKLQEVNSKPLVKEVKINKPKETATSGVVTEDEKETVQNKNKSWIKY